MPAGSEARGGRNPPAAAARAACVGTPREARIAGVRGPGQMLNPGRDSEDAKTDLPLPLIVAARGDGRRSEEHTSELQSPDHLVCRLLLEKKKTVGTRTADFAAPRLFASRTR